MNVAYHLVAEAWFQSQPVERPYLPEGFEREGFIHLTHRLDEVLAAGNRYYRDDPRTYLLLTVDLDAVTSEVRYEDVERRFPHIHGTLGREAIVGVNGVRRDDDGMFVALGPAVR